MPLTILEKYVPAFKELLCWLGISSLCKMASGPEVSRDPCVLHIYPAVQVVPACPCLTKAVWTPTKSMWQSPASPPNQKKHILHSFRGEKSQSHNWLCIAGIFVRGAKKKTFKIFDLFWVRFCSLGLTSCPQGGEARRQLVLLGQGKAASKIQKWGEKTFFKDIRVR